MVTPRGAAANGARASSVAMTPSTMPNVWVAMISKVTGPSAPTMVSSSPGLPKSETTSEGSRRIAAHTSAWES